jgi:hypothetical protein
MPYWWYLPDRPRWLWVCGALLLVMVPVSVVHDRNWKRTLAAYAGERLNAGASAGAWPPSEHRLLMGAQLWLVLLVTCLLAVMTAVAVWAALLWPRRPPGFDLPVNFYDLPYLWGMVVIGLAAVVAGTAFAVAIWRSPWWPVARKLRRAVYANEEERDRLFAEALGLDPELKGRV